jgi:hypothetical protein
MYGKFSMDMSKASVDSTAEVKQEQLSAMGTWQNKDAKLIEEPTSDRGGWRGTTHAILMCSTIVVLFPIGVVFLRLLENVIWHAWMQGVGCLFIVTGVGVGVWAGKQYNQVRSFKEEHWEDRC